jgi:peptidoglycan/LPS O-acetylase OafA/YrhL
MSALPAQSSEPPSTESAQPATGQGAPISDGAPGTAGAGEKPRRSGARLAWLDALRGFAALCVVFDHAGYYVLTGARDWVYQWFDPGQYGVFVFFLVSGYIIPASLERKGSLRGFWISRVFRLYPLYLLAVVLAWVAATNGIGNLKGAQHHPLTSISAWLLMMPNILVKNLTVPDVTWTLSFEMVFYLVVAALYSWNLHRYSGGYALGLSIGAVALGGVLPLSALVDFASGAGGDSGVRLLCIVADVLIIGGVSLSAIKSGKGGQVQLAGKIGAGIAAATGLILLFTNMYYPFPFSGFQILALMFTGTLIYRAEQGQTSKVKALVISLAVLVLTLAAGLWHGDYSTAWQWQWVTSLVAAAVTFALGMAVKNRTLPGWLAWLGLVSYSVYLLHPLVIDAYAHYSKRLGGTHLGQGAQVFIAAGLVAAVLVVSACAYYFLEKPMQKAGRRLTARLGG